MIKKQAATAPVASIMKPVQVELPIVKLRVEDLSYLRGMDQSSDDPAVIKCKIPDGNFHRLLVLGLVERFELPPCPKQMEEFEKKRNETEAKIRAAVKPKSIDWNVLSGYYFSGLGDSSRPKKRESIRITDAGRALIKNGVAQVQIAKSCR